MALRDMLSDPPSLPVSINRPLLSTRPAACCACTTTRLVAAATPLVLLGVALVVIGFLLPLYIDRRISEAVLDLRIVENNASQVRKRPGSLHATPLLNSDAGGTYTLH